MIGKSTIVWIGLACMASAILYQTSYEVQEQEEQLARLNRQIVAEQEAIQVLKAEWAYLNDPTRIERLVAEHMILQPTKSTQIVGLDAIPQVDPMLVASLPTSPVPGRKPGSRLDRAPSKVEVASADAPPKARPGDTAKAPVVMVNYGAAR
ncbi:hypothetical protein HHL28_03385 [Aerophototrophica crusticola]|uniref:Cell division protein FtsL n=1 Tax=Aerophototrophica crusticola TaxID=1709002 RepID=A0A858R496_9PROT|nr:hypothetical protein HHL28_03385 [Rhodospirillaceae bacterium B3]